MTHDITKYCKAAVFSKVGKQTPLAVRFSTVGGESGSADTARSNSPDSPSSADNI